MLIGPTQSQTIRECRNALVYLAERNRIILYWMSGYQGIQEDEKRASRVETCIWNCLSEHLKYNNGLAKTIAH